MKRILYFLVAVCFAVWLIFNLKEKKEITKPKNKIEISTKERTYKIFYKTTPYPFIIEPNHKKIYLYEKKSSKIIVVEGKDAKKLTSRKVIRRLTRYALEDTLCYKLAGRRFICIFKNARYKEVSLYLNCDVLIVSTEFYKTKFPNILRDFLKEWIEKWENIKNDFVSYERLYSEDFHNKYGDKKRWMKIRKKNLKETKYIDVLIDNISMFIIPNSNFYVILFDQTYRSNLRRVDSKKALVVKIEKNKPFIVSEVVL